MITGPGLVSYPDGPEKQSLPPLDVVDVSCSAYLTAPCSALNKYLFLTLERYTRKTTTAGDYASSAVQMLLVSV